MGFDTKFEDNDALYKFWKEYTYLIDCRRKIIRARREIHVKNRFNTKKRKKMDDQSKD